MMDSASEEETAPNSDCVPTPSSSTPPPSSTSPASKSARKKSVAVWKQTDGKPVQYKQKYKTEWEDDPQFQGWVSKSIKGPYYYYCTACDCTGNCGKSDLIRHARSTKHINNFKGMPKKQRLKKISGLEVQFYFCKICNKKFQSLKHTLVSHKKSAKHKANLGEIEDDEDNIVLLSNSQQQRMKFHEGERDDDEEWGNERSPTKKEPNNQTPSIIIKSTSGLTNEGSFNFATEQKVNTANGSFVILRCEKPIFPVAPPSFTRSPAPITICANPEVEKLVTDVSNVFRSDLASFLNRNEAFLKSIHQNESFASGEAGLIRLTRLMVSHMANQYFSEFTIDSWKNDCPDTSQKRCVATKLSELEQSMEHTVTTLKLMKAELENREDMLQPEISLKTMDIDGF